MPKVSTGRGGVSYVKTAGGNTVGVRMDQQGRLYMFDRAGNLYYDTGDQRLGFYIVRPPSPAHGPAASLRHALHCTPCTSSSWRVHAGAHAQCKLHAAHLSSECNKQPGQHIIRHFDSPAVIPPLHMCFPMQVTADNKVYNVFLDSNGAEQRRYVGDIRDVRTFKATPAPPPGPA